jgi:hypothetical protein
LNKINLVSGSNTDAKAIDRNNNPAGINPKAKDGETKIGILSVANHAFQVPVRILKPMIKK